MQGEKLVAFFARRGAPGLVAAAALVLSVAAGPLRADGGVVFTNIAPGAGITYERTPSPRKAVRDAINATPFLIADFATVRAGTPQKERGSPGVAIFDYDNDGDYDIYVTNGPGTPNSLYKNLFAETGVVTFVDVAAAAGVELTSVDASGVCYGDVDNDGDEDLYVVSTGGPNTLFENQGDGTFRDITSSGATAGSGQNAVGCSMADFNGDGLLDIVVANTYDDWTHRKPTFVNALYPGLQPNSLYLNTGLSHGHTTFIDDSVASGITHVDGLPGGSFTWAIAAADIDLDGDVDVLFADTQGVTPTNPSEDRGYNRWLRNDGHAHFTDVSYAAGLNEFGSWMGLSFGDFNCDGYMDFFSTNLGYYIGGHINLSRWFLGGPGGVFTDPGVGALGGTEFGWGTVTFDYDNDGDTDILWRGDDDILSPLPTANPGSLLQNQDCTASFVQDIDAQEVDNRFREVHALAIGDFNRDGFQDIVSVSNFNIVPLRQFPWIGILSPPSGSTLDPYATFESVFTSVTNPGFFTWRDPILPNGDMTVEINSADNGNDWASFAPRGSVGTLDDGKVNRDGFGAVLFFTPEGGKTSMQPLVGGASYGSENAREIIFGLGTAAKGTVDVLWPGGVRNRLYDVHPGERLVLPEIPCSYAASWKNFGKYNSCVQQALNGLKHEHVLSESQVQRFRDSARRAFDEAQGH